MSDPQEAKGYRAKLRLSIKLDGLEFDHYNKFEFEVPSWKVDHGEDLNDEAIYQFKVKHHDLFIDLDTEIEVLSIKKF